MPSQPPPLPALPDLAKVKKLEVKHAVVMSEVSKIVEALKDMDL